MIHHRSLPLKLLLQLMMTWIAIHVMFTYTPLFFAGASESDHVDVSPGAALPANDDPLPCIPLPNEIEALRQAHRVNTSIGSGLEGLLSLAVKQVAGLVAAIQARDRAVCISIEIWVLSECHFWNFYINRKTASRLNL
jgi:hypothetical protein